MDKKRDNVYGRFEASKSKACLNKYTRERLVSESKASLKYTRERLTELEDNFKISNWFVRLYVVGRFVSWLIREEEK